MEIQVIVLGFRPNESYSVDESVFFLETYSTCGRTLVLYAASRIPVYLVLMFLLIKTGGLLAFELILFICVLKFKLVDKSTS